MSHQPKKYKLGVFVVTSFTVLIIALFLFGAFNIFKTRIKCMTVVKSSVQGLAIGAKVKYNGVPIGEVEDIKVAPRGEYVFIYMSIFPETLHYIQETNTSRSESFKNFIAEGIKKGLRCQLRYEGITGTLYQEIQFLSANMSQIDKLPPLPDGHPTFIPSVQPVLLSNLISKINLSLEKLSGMDKTFKEVNTVLENINNYLNSRQMKSIIDDFQKIAKNINNISDKLDKTLTETKINKITDNIVETLNETRRLINSIDLEVERSNIPELSSEARKAISSTEALVNLLKNYPNAIIWGKPEKKIVPSY